MKYAELVALYEELEKTAKRLEKTGALSQFLKKLDDREVEQVILLLQGRVYHAWDEREVGVAAQLMVRAISIATGSTSAQVEKEWKTTGDLGKTAENLISRKKQATLASTELSVAKVFDNLRKLAETIGAGSVDRKLNLIAELMTSAKPKEALYIARTVLGQLRIGLGSGVMRDSIVWAYFPDTVPSEENAEREDYKKISDKVQQAYDLTNDFSVVAVAAKKGEKFLDNIELQILSPIKVMLAIKADTIAECFEIAGTPVEAEYKFDGFRMQIHRKGKKVAVFTRRLDNVSRQFPEVEGYVKEYVSGDNFILDAEAVGFDPKTRRYLPFQNISQRIKRKYDIEKLATELPVEVNVFDIIAYNGKNIIHEPFRKRREIIEKIVKHVPRKILPAPKLVSGNDAEILKFFRESKAMGNEGIMIKNLGAPYKPGSRVGYMLKYKETMETLDLAIVGAEWREGKRSKWLSSFILGCKSDGKFLEIGKAATGLKEKREEGLSFDEMTELLKPLIIEENGKTVKIKPKIVIEVAFEEIQKSPTYSSGYALRFPRIISLRVDKPASEVNTVSEIEKFYAGQRFRKAKVK